jgi:MoxR-like ATPase
MRADDDEGAMTNEPWANTPVLRVVGGSNVKEASAEASPEGAEAKAEATERGLEHAKKVGERLRAGLRAVIFGQEDVITGVVVALLAGGHVLLEGAPGLGKTQIVRTLSKLVGGSFSRIQFTPDLMPSDIVGTSLVVTTANGGKDLAYRPGPIFANLILADEINRATPKTQSALLEAMAERTVSVEGQPRDLPSPFFVLATENPIEMEGVFPLPEAQLDRFLMKLIVTMPDLETLTRIGARAEEPKPPSAVTFPDELLEVQAAVRQLPSAPHVERYAAKLTLATHTEKGVRYGAGPRAAQALMSCARARAVLDGRAAVAADDVRAVAGDVLRHRLGLRFEAEAQGLDADKIILQAIAHTKVE